ncbi:MAG: prepilin-type N-terminal cleavage/methylation domain-containing protein [Peptococcaceae bacterium]|nr:prepilin-type N-terminal cleavage/methylation domain-containing protein [Peptococcaceae bacterium]
MSGNKGEQGFTLVEVLVAMTLMVLVMIPLAGLINQGTIDSEQLQDRTVAMSLATGYLEQIKSYLPVTPDDFTPTTPQSIPPVVLGDISHMQNNPATTTETVNGTITKQFSYYLTTDDPNYMATPANDPTYISAATANGVYRFYEMPVTVTVTWHDNWSNSQKSISLSTLMVGR